MADTIPAADVAARLAALPVWRQAPDGWLQADLTFASFARALQFLNAVAHLSEQIDHHPDLALHGYKHLRIRVMSHDVGGITERDFRLIEAISGLPGGDRHGAE